MYKPLSNEQINAIKNQLNGFNKTNLPSYLFQAILNDEPITKELSSLDGIMLITWLDDEINGKHKRLF